MYGMFYIISERDGTIIDTHLTWPSEDELRKHAFDAGSTIEVHVTDDGHVVDCYEAPSMSLANAQTLLAIQGEHAGMIRTALVLPMPKQLLNFGRKKEYHNDTTYFETDDAMLTERLREVFDDEVIDRPDVGVDRDFTPAQEQLIQRILANYGLSDDEQGTAIIQKPFILRVSGGSDGYIRGILIDAPMPTITTSPVLALAVPRLITPAADCVFDRNFPTSWAGQ